MHIKDLNNLFSEKYLYEGEKQPEIKPIIYNLENPEQYNPYCSQTASLILFFYNIEDSVKITRLTHGNKNKNGMQSIYHVFRLKDIDKKEYLIPCPTILQAKYFLRTKFNIDIIEYPVLDKQEKVYQADIWYKNRLIKYKKYTKTNKKFKTPEEAFDYALTYVLTRIETIPSVTKTYNGVMYTLQNNIKKDEVYGCAMNMNTMPKLCYSFKAT